MGKFYPVLLAFINNCAGLYIFRKPDHSTCFPYFSYVIFLLAIYFILWDIPLNPYPACFRKLPAPANFFIQFLVCSLVMELIMSDFWLPLEAKVAVFLPTIVDYIDQLAAEQGYNIPYIDDAKAILKKKETLIGTSYVLSSFFLLCIIHTTRVVDFRLLQCSIGAFAVDIQKRLTKFAKNLIGIKNSCHRQGSNHICPSRLPKRQHHSATCESDWEDSSFDTLNTESVGSLRHLSNTKK